MTLENVPNTGMAVTVDIGEANNIHPKNKQEVGRRLALWALTKNYGRNIDFSGPIYKKMKAEHGKIYLTFTHGEGLVAKGGGLKNFAIAGENRNFVPARAVIKDGSIIVETPEVKVPVAVRYGWADDPEGCNLYNVAGLPASPFRTDSWAEISK
jgi:sialate O-acetylesterase